MSVEAEGSLVANGISSDFSGCRCSFEVPQEVREALATTDETLRRNDECDFGPYSLGVENGDVDNVTLV